MSKRKRAKRTSEEKDRSLVANIRDVTWTTDEHGKTVFVSPNIEHIYGYTSEEICEADDSLWLGRIHPDDVDGVRTAFEALFAEDRPFEIEYRIQRKDGRWIWLHDRSVYIYESNGIAYAEGIFTDVTERKLAENALRETRERYSALFTGITDAVFVHHITDDGLPGAVIEVNDVACRMLGYSKDELLRMGIGDIDAPETTADVRAIVEELRAGRAVLFEQTHVAKDGTRIPVEVHAQTFDFDGRPAILSTVRDLTERKRAEEEQLSLERQVQQAQKLESLGTLAGGIAHDFNNLLMAILGNADLALRDLSPHAPARHNVKEIVKASRCAAELARQMLAYSGKGRFVIEPIDLNEFVEEMSHLLEVSVSKKVALKYNFADSLPVIEGDATQVRQVIMNLITNASEAIGDNSGVISVSTGVMDCDTTYLNNIRVDEDLPEGTYVFLEVADTGCGMDEETTAKIFDPFFTTKFTGRGLGMAAVLGIVHGHNGAIKIYSEPGKGSTIKVLFPVSDKYRGTGPVQETGETGAETPVPAMPGTILFADDEKTIRVVGKEMLEQAGFTVLTAADGRAALDVFREHAADIVCVILDLTMPRMDGEETFRELRRIDKDVRVIMSSGYNEQEITQRFAGKGLAGFIQKPYQSHELTEKLMQVLEG